MRAAGTVEVALVLKYSDSPMAAMTYRPWGCGGVGEGGEWVGGGGVEGGGEVGGLG